VAAAPDHPGLPGSRVGGELLGDAGLADAGLAADQHELTLPAERTVQRGVQRRPLGATADEGQPVGVLGALGDQRRRRGEVRVRQREDVLGPRQSLQRVRADVDQPGAVRELVGHQLGRRPRQQDLAALTERPQPSGPVERRSVVVAAAQLGLAGVQRGPRGEGDGAGPAFRDQQLLEGQGCGRCVACPREDREGRVALSLGLDQPPRVGGDGPGDERLVLGEGGAHDPTVPLPEGRGSLDVGQQEGEDAFRKPVGPATHQPTPGRGSSAGIFPQLHSPGRPPAVRRGWA
jgi:hypothetical protein